MQNRRQFQNFMCIVLYSAIVSFIVDKGNGIRSDSVTALEDCSEGFKCDNGKCIKSSYKCDEEDDCKDGSDERGCFAEQCTPNQFYCESGKCIPKVDRCDGYKDCLDGSDEASCSSCSSKAFTCRSGKCLFSMLQCNNNTDCSDGSDEICPEGLTPTAWIENLHSLENERMTRRFLNDDIVVYFDAEWNEHVDWMFRPLSDAWKYAKQTYGPIGTNSILYVLLHEQFTVESNCVTYSSDHVLSGHRNLLDCSQQDGVWWTENTSTVFEALFSPLGKIIRDGSKVVSKDIYKAICGGKIKDILFYDIYVHLKGEFSAEVVAWAFRAQKESTIRKERNLLTYCFRDWFLPIYRQFGQSRVLTNYFKSIQSNWARGNTVAHSSFNLGQFVHFWSGSAGVDLQPLALKAFSWTSKDQQELKEAREAYRALHYEANNYTLVFDDNNIAVKFENYQDYNVKIYDAISNVWTYVKTGYIPQNVNLQLEVILEDRDHKLGTRVTHIGCDFSQIGILKRSVGSITNRQRQRGTEPIQPHFEMTCGKSVFKQWSDTSGDILDLMLEQMAHVALNTLVINNHDIKHGDNPTGRSVQSIISELDLQPVVVYDIFLGLKLDQNAERWKLKQSRKRSNFPQRATHLFRDWYLEIYKAHDTRFLKIVPSFVLLVKGRFNSTATNKTRQLNMGEFVHFWSGAVGVNLVDLAENSFKWKPEGQKQFYEARKQFPGLPYDCETCNQSFDSSTAATDNDNSAEEGPEPHKGEYTTIAIVVGTSVAILIAVLICFGVKFLADRRRIQNLSLEIRNLTQNELDEFHLGNTDLSPTDLHAPVHSLPYKNKFEVPRERLVIDEKCVLGSGAFGIVKRGLLLGDEFLGTPNTVVAVKIAKKLIDITYFKAQLLEIKIMAYLGKHENIASLLGTVTTNIIKCEVLFALEFCLNGDLHKYLNKHREHFTDLWISFESNNNPSTRSKRLDSDSKPDLHAEVTILPRTNDVSSTHIVYRKKPEVPVLFSTLNLLTWLRQIACGMEYLGLKGVIHGDLAARNVLLTEKNVAKISDFGLSRQLVNYSNYRKTSTTPLPWRWLAIESLSQKIFSANSDVWSFGVTLWELFTLGSLPYPGRTWDQKFVRELNEGMRLDTPEFGNEEIYNLMMNCMEKVPSDRIPFSQIGGKLDRIKAILIKAQSPSNIRHSREVLYVACT